MQWLERRSLKFQPHCTNLHALAGKILKWYERSRDVGVLVVLLEGGGAMYDNSEGFKDSLSQNLAFFHKASNGIYDLVDPRPPLGCSWVQPQGC